MTVSHIYEKLYSRPFFEKTGQHKVKFVNNNLGIDRRAYIPFSVFLSNGSFYLETYQEIANQSLFRLEMNEDGILFYSENSASPFWILE